MKIINYRDLRVWQAGMDLVEWVYRSTKTFPNHELYGLANQLRRAAISIPSNIAEGHTRQYSKEYLQHLAVAQASLAELETQFEIAKRLEYISSIELGQILECSTSLGKQLYALRNAVQKRIAK